MGVTLGLLGLAVVFVLFLVRYSPWRSATVQPEELHSVLEPVYVPALMNLIDERNLEFLRRSLTASDFRKAQRERARALRVYVRRIAHNTRVLIATAESAQRALDPAVADSARVLLAASLSTRTRAVRALAFLYVAEVFPNRLPDLADAIRTYESATARMNSLQSLTSTE
jgi:hypothetical protein